MSNARQNATEFIADLERPQRVSVDQAIDRRIAGLTDWLEENAQGIDQQQHLDEGSRERAYWHYGYLVALRDLRDLLCGRRHDLN
jgi:hypothetical protein